MDALLAGPYLLATSLSTPSSVCPTGDGDLLVATAAGAVRLDPEGRATPLGVPAERVTSTPHHLVFLSGGTLAWLPTREESQARGGQGAVEKATDVLGWTRDTVLVAQPDAVWEFSLATGDRELWSTAAGVTGLALGPGPGQALGVRGSEVLLLESGSVQRHRSGIPDLRQVAHDGEGRLWGLVGDTLAELQPEGPVRFAEHLGDPVDLHAGAGHGFSSMHLFVADAAGAVAFVPVPPGGSPDVPASRLAKPRMGR